MGAHVTPNIRLVRLLGHGGMGSVWVADHLGLRTQVVVKFVSSELADDADVRDRFEREAALAAQAKSPHVVQVLDHGATGFGVPYIAMELLEGEDLGKRIARDRTVPPALLADWLTQACKGLGRAHAKGIVHRDIKPENIFLSETDGEVVVKVLDFGIAKGVGQAAFSGTKSGAFLGTAYFMSPEQTMGAKHIDLRTDLWSMAVTAYLALTGVRPFEAESIGAIVVAITAGPIAPPSTLNPHLGPSIDAWMAKAIARPLDERFSSAKEMADAFSAAVAASTLPTPQLPSALAYTAQPPLQPMQVRFSTSVGVVSERAPPLPSMETTSLSPAHSRGWGALVLAIVGALLLLGGGGIVAVRASSAGRAPQAVGLAQKPPAAAVSAILTATLPPSVAQVDVTSVPAPPSSPVIAPPVAVRRARPVPAPPPLTAANAPSERSAKSQENTPSVPATLPAAPKPTAATKSTATAPPNHLKMGLE